MVVLMAFENCQGFQPGLSRDNGDLNSTSTSTAIPNGLSYSSVLDRAMPPNSKNLYVALRSLANNEYVVVKGDHTLGTTSGSLSAGGLFLLEKVSATAFYLKSAATGAYIYVDQTSRFVRADGTVADEFAEFESVERGDYALNIQSKRVGCYLTADLTNGGGIIANRNVPSGWEAFKLLPVLDMSATFSAFADLHPSQSKNRTLNSNTGTAYYNNKAVFERRVASGANQIIVTEVGHDDVKIYDWYWLEDDRVGLHGTFPIYATGDVHVTDPMVPYSARYLTPDTVGQKINGEFNYLQGNQKNANFVTKGTGNLPNLISAIGIRDLGGNIRKRWVVTVSTDLDALPTSIGESFSFDLGPADGVFAPEFGLVGYDQTNKPGGGSTSESYGDLESIPDAHFSFFDLFSY